MLGYSDFVFRDIEPRKQSPSSIPVVSGLIQRGDEAMWSDDWQSAENCYVAAHFILGGQDNTTKTKIGMVKRIMNVQAVAKHASARVESARYTANMLSATLEDIEEALDALLPLRIELPHSEDLMTVEGHLDSVLRKGRRMQASYPH